MGTRKGPTTRTSAKSKVKTPTKRTQSSVNKKHAASKMVNEESSDEGEESSDALEDLSKCSIDWNKDHDLNLELINTIAGNNDIKQGLFPSPGAAMSVLKHGGNKKTVWQWKVAVAIFTDHPKYGVAFAQTLNCPDAKLASRRQSAWATKIKNRLTKMVAITKEHIQMLGQTGEGIDRAEDVDMSKKNEFTNKWAAILDSCPWFLEMRALVAQRPNIVTVGIGNSTSNIDFDVIQEKPSYVPSDYEQQLDTEIEPVSEGITTTRETTSGTSDIERDAQSSSSDNEDITTMSTVGSKRKSSSNLDLINSCAPKNTKVDADIKVENKPTSGATSARLLASKSAPVIPKKRTLIEEFNTVAQAEEITRQKELDLQREKINSETKLKIEALATKQKLIDAQTEKLRLREARKIEKMKIQQQYRMEKLRWRNQGLVNGNSLVENGQPMVPPPAVQTMFDGGLSNGADGSAFDMQSEWASEM